MFKWLKKLTNKPVANVRKHRKAKTDSVHSRRLLTSLFPEELAKKLIIDIAPRYKERKGGYTRIIKLGPRKGDGAKMAIIEFIK